MEPPLAVSTRPSWAGEAAAAKTSALAAVCWEGAEEAGGCGWQASGRGGPECLWPSWLSTREGSGCRANSPGGGREGEGD